MEKPLVTQARIGFSLLLLAAAANLGMATNIACSAAAINDPTVQAGSPPGCTQVDMQFSLLEPVVAQVVDTTDSSTVPTDASVGYNGLGVAGGTGANSQGLDLFQIGRVAFAGNDADNLTTAEEWHYTFTIGVTDIGGGQITGAYLQLGQLNLVGNAIVNNISETICSGTTTFSGTCTGASVISDDTGITMDLPLGPTLMAAAQFDLDIELLGPGDGFGLSDFEMGFDEDFTTPEPATWLLMATALAAFLTLHKCRTRRRKAHL